MSLPFGGARPVHLPQVVVDGDGVHTGGYSLSRDDCELLAIAAVFVKLVNHFAGDGAGACAGQLQDLLRVRSEGIKRPKLAATITEQDHQMVGLTALNFLLIN